MSDDTPDHTLSGATDRGNEIGNYEAEACAVRRSAGRREELQLANEADARTRHDV